MRKNNGQKDKNKNGKKTGKLKGLIGRFKKKKPTGVRGKSKKSSKGRWIQIIGFMLPVLLIFGNELYKMENKPDEITYNEFMAQVKEENVEKASINKGKGIVVYKTTKGDYHETTYPDYDTFTKEMLEQGVDVSFKHSLTMSTFMTIAFPFIFILAIYLQMRGMKGKNTAKKVGDDIETPDVTFEDVAGYAEVKDSVRNLVSFLKEPDKYLDSGARMPKGMILYGDPGTGKTLMAKAIAGEAGVPFYSTNGSDFIELYVGMGARRIRKAFEEARDNAPCILFIDEIDAIGGKRNNSRTDSEDTKALNALLSQMDGFDEEDGVLVIATTNRLDVLDPALIRPGRFDMHVKVPVPQTPEERLEIIHVHTKNKTFAEDVDFKALSKQWIGFSGADIESIINSATIIAVDNGKDKVDMASLNEAFDRKILKGHFKKDAQKNRSKDVLNLVAYHEAGHAVLGKLLETGNSVSRVTILPSTTGAGGVTFFSPNKMGLHTIQELENEVKVLYAGRVAELLLYGDQKRVTTGASADIEQATAKIKQMISAYGMTQGVGMVNLEELGVDKDILMKEALLLSTRLYRETEHLMRGHWNTVVCVAEALLERETISEDELDELMKASKASSNDLELPDELSRELVDLGAIS